MTDSGTSSAKTTSRSPCIDRLRQTQVSGEVCLAVELIARFHQKLLTIMMIVTADHYRL